MGKESPADIEARAVKDERGNALVFDLWVNQRWVGSRATPEQCEQHLSWIVGAPVQATFGSPW